MGHLTAIVLAAGHSSRFEGRNKLLLPFRGKALVAHVVEALCAAPVEDVLVVTGHEAGRVRKGIAGNAVRIVHNPAYATGMSSSIRAGIQAAHPETEGYLIALGDMPLVEARMLASLCARFRAETGAPIVAAAVEGWRGPPVVFHRAYREELLSLTGDVGARQVIEQNKEALVTVAIEDRGIFQDVDTWEAYEEIRRRGSSMD